MYELWRTLINFPNQSTYNSIETYILYGAMSMTILFIVVILDHTLRLIKSFFK